MNGLNNSQLFPFSLNNLQQISTTDGGSLPVQADVPIIKTLTTTAQEIALYESSPNVIDFEFYNKSLNVANFEANNILSNGSMNAPAANISCFAVSPTSFVFSPFYTGARMDIGIIRANTGAINSLTGGQLTFNTGVFNTITANNIVINSVNIPNLTFNTATGSQLFTQNIDNSTDIQTQTLSATGGITSNTSLRTTNGPNTFDFTDISSDGTTSIYNAGGALQTSFRFDGTERMKLSSSGNLDVSLLQFTGATGGNLFANDIVATTNIISNGSLNAPVANIASFALTASGFVNAPSFSGASANFGNLRVNTGSFNSISATGMNLQNLVFTTATGTNLTSTNISFTTATGGTLRSSVAIRNPQTLSFNKTDNTEIVRIEPAGVADVLSFFNPGGVLQTLYQTTSSGANVDNLNQLGSKDITNLGRIFNGDGTETLPSYTFLNDTNTGFRRIGSDNIGLSLGGTQKVNYQSNLITLGSSSNNSVGEAINGDLQVGRTSFNNVALINLGFSGASFGVNPGRQGFITMDGTNMTISNTQANTGSTSHGSIFITPANNGTIRLLKQADGVLSNIGRNDGYAHQFSNLQTGGLGMLTTLVNKPDSAYLFSSQGPGFNSAITMHGSLGSQLSNITIGRTNFPFTNNEGITMRPWTPTGSLSIGMKISNQVSESNGFAMFGMFASGTNSINRNHTYISNSAVLGGIGFYTNEPAVVPTTYPRYLIDVAGNHSWSIKTATGVFGATSIPYAVGIGESFSATRGNGRYVPVARGNLNNTSYTGGTEFIARGTADSNNNHSAYTTNGFSADWKGYYRIQWNVNGSFATSADTLFIRVKVAGVVKNTCACQFPTTGQIGNSTGYALVNVNESDDIDLFFEPDTNRFDCANDGYFLIEYVG